MADASLLRIRQMIDYAIGTPEVGVVDFNMLHAVLYCLAQQLNVLDKHVELRGDAAPLPIHHEPTQSIAINEFTIETEDEAANKFKKIEKTAPNLHPPDTDTMLVVERLRKTPPPKATPPAPPSKPSPPGTSEPSTPVHTVAPTKESSPTSSAKLPTSKASLQETTSAIGSKVHVPSSEKLSLVTLSKFNVLAETVEDIRQRVYGSIPKNEDLLEEVRSQTNIKAITDMWTSLNVSSRLEAAEEGIAKLSSLVQDVIGDNAHLQEQIGQVSQMAGLQGEGRKLSSESGGGGAGATGGEPHGGAGSASTTGVHGGPGSTYGGAGALGGGGGHDDADGHGGAVRPGGAPGTGTENASGASAPGAEQGGGAPGIDGTTEGGGGPGATVDGSGVDGAGGGLGIEPRTISPPVSLALADFPSINGYLKDLREDLFHLAGVVQGVKDELGLPQPAEDGAVVSVPKESFREIAAALMLRTNNLEKKIKECCESINKNEGVMQDQMNSLQDQVEYLIKQTADVAQQQEEGKLCPELLKDMQGLMQLFQTVQSMQIRLKEVHETALQLAAEKEDRKQHIHNLLEQIELLKVIKLDREDMIEAMADKADIRMLARKVSHDQFEMACDDLSKGLEHAVGKLNFQESLWQQALDDIQREIETKLDKMELSPVKEFFNKKLKQLHENLKQLASLRREVIAAGAKKKLLRDVNCISCDADAVMSMEATGPTPSKPLPPSHSMKPYLTYELDAIRKTQACNVSQRNMRDWENIDKQMQAQKAPPVKTRPRPETDKHLCNRYCGGSHTVTTAVQRVARLGHFVKQWGPEVLPLSSGLAAGDDGKMYKVTVDTPATGGPVGAVEAPCTQAPPKEEPPKPPHRPIVISAECRCLAGDSTKR